MSNCIDFSFRTRRSWRPRLRHWNVCIPRFQRRLRKGPTAEAARTSTWSFVSSSLTPCVTSSGRQRHALHSGPSGTTRGCIARCSNGPRQSGRSYAQRVLTCQTHAVESSNKAMDADAEQAAPAACSARVAGIGADKFRYPLPYEGEPL